MKTTLVLSAAALALGALAPAASAFQANGLAGQPRSTDNRTTTEQATPPPVNSDYRKAAEGTLPTVPGTNVVAPTAPGAGGIGTGIAPRAGQGAIDPATPIVPGRIGDGQGDPAAGLQPGARNLDIERTRMNRIGTPGTPGSMPSGLDVAMLIEHSVAMAMEAAALQAVGEQSSDDPASKALADHAREQMVKAKAMLALAAQDGQAIPATSPTRRFYGAANNYMTTLGQLTAPGSPATPADRATVSMINHAVKHVLDAGHIRQFAPAYPGSPATGQMLDHAREMRTEGIDNVNRIAGSSPVDPAGPASPVLLAQRGRELLEASDQVTALVPAGPRMSGVPGVGINPNATPNGLPQDPNPGRLRDTRPEIIGGNGATGSPTAGTATAAEAAANVRNARELPNGQLVVPTPNGAPGSGTSNYGEGNNNTPPTNSTAGSRPR